SMMGVVIGTTRSYTTRTHRRSNARDVSRCAGAGAAGGSPRRAIVGERTRRHPRSHTALRARKTEDALRDDVPLDFRRPCVDRSAARPQVLVLPPPRVDGVRVAALDLRVWTFDVDRDVLHAHVRLAPEELQVRALGAGVAGPHHLAHLLVGDEPDDLRF